MIVFDLLCTPGEHRFEGWFGSADDYEKQLESGLLCCPMCGSADVTRQLSAPHVGPKGNSRSTHPAQRRRDEERAPQAQPDGGGEGGDTPMTASWPAEARAALSKLAEMQGKLLEKSEWVGRSFGEEARAIHYGESPERPIHGESDADEAVELAEEGISVSPLLFPVVPPDSKN